METVSTVADHEQGFSMTTWGKKRGQQVWRIRWRGRPGMVVELTGPDDQTSAFVKAWDFRDRLPWRADLP